MLLGPVSAFSFGQSRSGRSQPPRLVVLETEELKCLTIGYGLRGAALDIMRSAGAEPTVGQALAATIVIGFAAPRTDPLIMIAIYAT